MSECFEIWYDDSFTLAWCKNAGKMMQKCRHSYKFNLKCVGGSTYMEYTSELSEVLSSIHFPQFVPLPFNDDPVIGLAWWGLTDELISLIGILLTIISMLYVTGIKELIIWEETQCITEYQCFPSHIYDWDILFWIEYFVIWLRK